jgi:ribosomal protein S21
LTRVELRTNESQQQLLGRFRKKVIKSGRLKGVRRKAVVRFKERITPDLEKESYSKTQT